MKKPLIVSTIATFISMAVLLGADAPAPLGGISGGSPDPAKTPDGLSQSDWSGIRGAYEKHRHAVVANPDGTLQARNPGQAWLTMFDRRGFTVTPDGGGWSWGLELAGCGEAAEVRHDGGRISYIRGDGLTEWFVNDTRGLEQGWTLAKRPDGAGASGPIRLELAVRGSLHPAVSGDGASVAFLNESGGSVLTYGGLKAWDAYEKCVEVRFEKSATGNNALRVMVDDTGARYPITIDPIAQQAYLKASNTGAGDSFGDSVAICGDTVVVGAPAENNFEIHSGAAYVFVRSGTAWSQQAYLKASNAAAQDYFGNAVAVSGDTVVVGAYLECSKATGVGGNQADNSAEDSGAAYVFVRSGTAWSQQAYLKASNTAAQDYFGVTVAISSDTVVIGATGEDSKATGVGGNQADNTAVHSGAAYVFVRSGTAWSQQAYLKASNTAAQDRFGESIAVSDDTVLIGALFEESSATGIGGDEADNSVQGAGAAYVFVRSGTTWNQQAYLKASNTGDSDYFGGSVSVAGDTAVIGASGEDSKATGVGGNQADNSAADSGAAYVFVRSGTAWRQQAYLKASNAAAQDRFGTAVAVSGETVLIGAYAEASDTTGVNGDDSNNTAVNSGAAYVFVRSGTAWSQQAYLKASNTAAQDYFGVTVAISNDTVVIGAIGEDSKATGVGGNQGDDSAAGSGAAYAFSGLGRHSLSASGANGSISGTGYYDHGDTATLTAIATPGYIFGSWSGDATGTENPLPVVMNTDMAVTATIAPDTRDDDGDGLTNYQEIVELGTDPTKPDTDGDGVKDKTDAFPLDPAETLDNDRDGTGDNTDLDDDGDGYMDVDEINVHHTNPKLADSDGDGLTDPAEIETHHTNPNLADTDTDGLRDGEEFTTYHTNPLLGDTDGDGFVDGYEVYTGKLPLDPLDKPALVAEARTAIEFTFPAAIGKTYRIEASTDLAAWGIVESGIAGTGGEVQRFYSTRGQPKRYFRVEEGG